MALKTRDELIAALQAAIRSADQGGNTSAADARGFLTTLLDEMLAGRQATEAELATLFGFTSTVSKQFLGPGQAQTTLDTTTGATVTDAELADGYTSSDFLPVEAGSALTILPFVAVGAWYDQHLQFVSPPTGQFTIANGVPAGAAFMRLAYPSTIYPTAYYVPGQLPYVRSINHTFPDAQGNVTTESGAGASQLLYDTTGQHTDGAMHQKAITDALANYAPLVDGQVPSHYLPSYANEVLFQIGNPYDPNDAHVHLMRMPVEQVQELLVGDRYTTVTIESEALDGHYHRTVMAYLRDRAVFFVVSITNVAADGTETEAPDALYNTVQPVGEPQTFQFQLYAVYDNEPIGFFTFGPTLAARITIFPFINKYGNSEYAYSGRGSVEIYSLTQYYSNYLDYGVYRAKVSYNQRRARYELTDFGIFNLTNYQPNAYGLRPMYSRQVGAADGGFRGAAELTDSASIAYNYGDFVVQRGNLLRCLSDTTDFPSADSSSWEVAILGSVPAAGGMTFLAELYQNGETITTTLALSGTDFAQLLDAGYVAYAKSAYVYSRQAFQNTRILVPLSRDTTTNSVYVNGEVKDEIGFNWYVQSLKPLLAGVYAGGVSLDTANTFTKPLTVDNQDGYSGAVVVAPGQISIQDPYQNTPVRLDVNGITFQQGSNYAGIALERSGGWDYDTLTLGGGNISHVKVPMLPTYNYDVANKAYVDSLAFPYVAEAVRTALQTADWSSGQPVPTPANPDGNEVPVGTKVYDANYRYELLPDFYYEFEGVNQWVRTARA